MKKTCTSPTAPAKSRLAVAQPVRRVQRLQKTLEDANIKLNSVISDIVGLSGRRMIEALIAGETEPGVLAAMAHRRIKATPDELEAALRGRVTRHHRFLLQLHLQQIDAVNAAIDQIDQEVDAYVEPFRATVRLLTVASCFWPRWTRWCRGRSCWRWWNRTTRGAGGAVVRRSVWPRCCGSTFFSNGSPCRTDRWRTGSTTSRACAGSRVFPMSRQPFPTKQRSSTFWNRAQKRRRTGDSRSRLDATRKPETPGQVQRVPRRRGCRRWFPPRPAALACSLQARPRRARNARHRRGR